MNTIHNEIISNLGGANFFACTGTKIMFFPDQNSILFKIVRNKTMANKAFIKKCGGLYSVILTEQRNDTIKNVKTVIDISPNDISKTFEEITGLFTKRWINKN